MIKRSIAIALTIFLISCKTKFICGQIEANLIKPVPLCDISIQFDECYCRCFNLNKFEKVDESLCTWKHGDFKEAAYPLSYCDGVGGFFLEDLAIEIKPKIKTLNNIKSDYCN